MDKTQRIFITISLILAFVVIGSYIYFVFMQPSPVTKKLPIKYESSPSPVESSLPETLQVTDISPREDTNIAYNPITSVEFIFNKEVDTSTIDIKTQPKVDVVLRMKEKNIVEITPKRWWTPGITTITLENTATSTDGGRFNRAIIYKINTKWPENPPEDEDY